MALAVRRDLPRDGPSEGMRSMTETNTERTERASDRAGPSSSSSSSIYLSKNETSLLEGPPLKERSKKEAEDEEEHTRAPQIQLVDLKDEGELISRLVNVFGFLYADVSRMIAVKGALTVECAYWQVALESKHDQLRKKDRPVAAFRFYLGKKVAGYAWTPDQVRKQLELERGRDESDVWNPTLERLAAAPNVRPIKEREPERDPQVAWLEHRYSEGKRLRAVGDD